MSRAITRRTALRSGAASAFALAGLTATPAWAGRAPARLARGGAFADGVAAGLPDAQGALVWTRLADVEGPNRVRLEVARDQGFQRVVHRADVIVDAGSDYTAKLNVTGAKLRPGSEYFYRFHSATADSPVGRFRTLPPADSTQPVRIGLFTCQAFPDGYYASHRGLAAEDLDLVVCLGDYIYEYTGPDSVVAGRADTTSDNESGRAESVQDYRAKYRLYRSDPNLRNLHASHAMLVMWDDHELINDYWRDGSEVGDGEMFRQRQAAAYRAWFEHLPVPRIDGPGGTRIYRSLRAGALAELYLLDQRQYRDQQPCDGAPVIPCPEAAEPGRTILGAEQKSWLKTQLTGSDARWKIVLSQSMMMANEQPLPSMALYLDAWDGYTAERAELAEFWLANGIDNVIVVAGDDHDNYAGILTTTGRHNGTPAAVEFVVPSTTSANEMETLYAGNEQLARISEANKLLANPHLKMADLRQHGYGVLEVDRDEARMSFRHIAARTDPDSPVSTSYRFAVPSGQVALNQL